METVIMFEVPASRVEGASEFYRKAFGWRIERWNGSDGVVAFRGDENWPPVQGSEASGEMYRRESGDDPTLVIVHVPSLAGTIDELKKAGAKVVSEKVPYGDWGWYTRVQDNEGHIYGLWEQKEAGAAS